MREFALSVFSFPSLFQCIDEGEADLRGKGTEGNREPCLLAAPTFKIIIIIINLSSAEIFLSIAAIHIYSLARTLWLSHAFQGSRIF